MTARTKALNEKYLALREQELQKGGVLLGGCGITGTYSLYSSLASIFYTDVLGISQSYISRLEKRILHRLRREMARLS